MNNILTINAGDCKMSIDMEKFFPCPRGHFGIVLDAMRDIVDTADQEACIAQVHGYLASRVAELQAERKEYDGDNSFCKAKLADLKKGIDKYIAYNKQLQAAFKWVGVEDITDTVETVKLTRCKDVYFLVSEGGKTTVKACNGHKFSKGGFDFEVYKHGKRSGYTILLAGTGLQCATAYNLSECLDAVDRVMDLLKAKKKSGEIKKMQAAFKAAMIEAGYWMEEKKASRKQGSKAGKKDGKAAGRKQDPKGNTEGSEGNAKAADKAGEASDTNTNDNTNTNNTKKEEATMMSKNYFEGIDNAADLRKAYIALVKANHTDNGGDLATIQAVNAQYDTALAAIRDGSAAEAVKAGGLDDVTDQSIRETIEKIIHIPGIEIEIVGTWVWVGGDTKPNKEAIKAAGGCWSKSRTKWYFKPEGSGKYHKGSGKSYEDLKAKYGSQKVKGQEREKLQ